MYLYPFSAMYIANFIAENIVAIIVSQQEVHMGRMFNVVF
jgi:hypothetical protein